MSIACGAVTNVARTVAPGYQFPQKIGLDGRPGRYREGWRISGRHGRTLARYAALACRVANVMRPAESLS